MIRDFVSGNIDQGRDGVSPGEKHKMRSRLSHYISGARTETGCWWGKTRSFDEQGSPCSSRLCATLQLFVEAFAVREMCKSFHLEAVCVRCVLRNKSAVAELKTLSADYLYLSHLCCDVTPDWVHPGSPPPLLVWLALCAGASCRVGTTTWTNL